MFLKSIFSSLFIVTLRENTRLNISTRFTVRVEEDKMIWRHEKVPEDYEEEFSDVERIKLLPDEDE